MVAKEEFIAITELVYSIYRDCRRSFGLNLLDMKMQQEIKLKELNANGRNWTIDDLDKTTFHYAVKDDVSRKIRSEAAFTQGEWKEKIGKDGTNIRHIGNMCLVMIYQYWDDRYRDEIAKSKGISKGELTSDLFGDIRHFRNSIIHNNGIAISEVNRCKILKWFRENDEIVIDAIKMDCLIDYIKKEVNTL